MCIRQGVACLVSGLMLLWSTAAPAECASNKVAVTLVNPAGKIIELCLPENAINGIEQGANDTGTVPILGHCPCFTQEEVEAVEGLECQVIGIGEFSAWIECSSSVGEYDVYACDTDVIACFRVPYCESPITGELWSPPVTYDELVACVAILEPLAAESP